MPDIQEKLDKIIEVQDLVDRLALATREEVTAALPKFKEGTPAHTLLKELQETRTVTASRAMEILEKDDLRKAKISANMSCNRLGFKLDEAEDSDENDPLRLTSNNVMLVKELPKGIAGIHDKVREMAEGNGCPAPASELLKALTDDMQVAKEENVEHLLATLEPALATALAKLRAKIYIRNGVVILGPLKGKVAVVRPRLPTAADFMVKDGRGRKEKPEEDPDNEEPDNEDLTQPCNDDGGEPDPALDGLDSPNELTQLAIAGKRRSEMADKHKKTLARLCEKFPNGKTTATKERLAKIRQELLEFKAKLAGEEFDPEQEKQEEPLDDEEGSETISLASGKSLRELLSTLAKLKHSFAIAPDEVDIDESTEKVEDFLLVLARLENPGTTTNPRSPGGPALRSRSPEQSGAILTTQALRLILIEIAERALSGDPDQIPKTSLTKLAKNARALAGRIQTSQIQRNLQSYLDLINRIDRATPEGQNVKKDHVRTLLNPTL